MDPLTNIAAHLPALARCQADTPAVHCPIRRGYATWTYRELDEKSNAIAHGLERIGIGRGVRTVLMVPPGLDFFALTFALFKVGAVPVLVDPGMGVRNLGQCLAEAEPEAFIGVGKAQLARILLGWGKRTLRTIVTAGRRWLWGGHTLREIADCGSRIADSGTGSSATTLQSAIHNPQSAMETAAILFTSGSTGPPKGAVYTHGQFTAQVELLKKTFAIEPGEIDLCTFPLFALFAPALGMSAIVPAMDATRPGQVHPPSIIEPIQRFGVTNLFGSPALLRRVGDYGVRHGVKLPSLRRVISAGAPVGAEVIEQFTQLLSPGVQVFTPYGSTEALPVACIGSDEILSETRQRTAQGGGVCVGRPVEGVDVSIIRISDEPIAAWSDDLLAPSGQIGEIVVRGPNVTREYFNRPAATALAKIPFVVPPSDGLAASPPEGGTTNSVIHRMGDLGYFDPQGRLWFCGRKSQRVITAAATLHTIPCEAVFNAHPQVFRTALVGVGKNGQARPVLCVEKRPTATAADEQIAQELLALGAAHEHTRGIRTILFHPGFPVDIRHNAKIGREELARWAERRLS